MGIIGWLIMVGLESLVFEGDESEWGCVMGLMSFISLIVI